MIDLVYRRLSYLVGYLAIGLFFGLLFLAAHIEIKDTDLWLHLATGRFIVQNGHVPNVDVLSCTIASQPWTNHEWLFQVIVYWIYQAWQADGLIKMQVVIVFLTMTFLLLLCYDKNKQLLTILLLLLIFPTYHQRFTIRPDLVSLLFFILYLYILSWHLNSRWSLSILFFIQILWSNTHGFFFLGPFLIFTGILSEWIKRHMPLPYEWNRSGRLEPEDYQRLKQIFGLVTLACLLNPYFLKGALYPIYVLVSLSGDSKIFFQHVQELHKPLSWNTIFSRDGYEYYKLMILVSGVSFIYNRKKIDVGILMAWAVFLASSLLAIRNMIYFSFFGVLVCTINFQNLSLSDLAEWTHFRFFNARIQHMVSTVIKMVLIIFLSDYMNTLSFNGYFDFDTYTRKSEFGSVSLRNFPYRAADFLVQHNIQGNFFNDFNSGAYLLGRCHPNIKVFIDGRTEEYGPEFFKLYNKIWKGDKKLFDEVVNQYNITGAFLSYMYVPAPVETMRALYHDPVWSLVYFDYDATIFLRKIPDNQDLIDQLTIDLTHWQPKSLDLIRLGTMSITPYQNMNRAHALFAFELYDAALAEAYEALKVKPDYFDPYKLIGEIYLVQGEYLKALEALRVAQNYVSSDVKVRYNLAIAFEQLGHIKKAINQCALMLHYEPQNTKGLFLLAKLYAQDQRYVESLVVLTSAHRIDTHEVKSLLEIGDLFYKSQNYQGAQEVYSLASETNTELVTIHNKLGLCYQAMGKMDLAKEEFQKALTIDPVNEDARSQLKQFEMGI